MVNFTITAHPLPADFSGTPQELFEAILDSLVIQADLENYSDSATMPASNQGPWFNGTKLYVWTGSVYEAVNTEESITPQIIASDTQPDSAVYQYWLKTSGPTVEGLYYFSGDTGGWISEAHVIPAGSLATIKFENGCVTTAKIADGSIKSPNILGPIPLSRMEVGQARQFLRMSDGLFPIWETINFTNGAGQPIAENTLVTHPHGLGEVPQKVSASLVCVTANLAWTPGDECRLGWSGLSSTYSGVGRNAICYVSDTAIRLRVGASPKMWDKNFTALSPVDLSNWLLKFYITKA